MKLLKLNKYYNYDQKQQQTKHTMIFNKHALQLRRYLKLKKLQSFNYQQKNFNIQQKGNKKPNNTIIHRNIYLTSQNKLSPIDLNPSEQPTIPTTLNNKIINLHELKTQLYSVNSNSWNLQLNVNQLRDKFINVQINQGAKVKTLQKENVFVQFVRKIVNITQPNIYLCQAKQQDYQGFPLLKLNQIALKFIRDLYPTNNYEPKQPTQKKKQPIYTSKQSTQTNQQPTQKNEQYGQTNKQQSYKNKQQSEQQRQKWTKLSQVIKKRLHNCSLKQHLRVLYIFLEAYPSFMSNQSLIKSLLIGLTKQVSLMQQLQSMQTFFILSHGIRPQYSIQQVRIKFLLSEQVPSKYGRYFQSPYIYSIQNLILQKVVEKYKHKYIGTELNFKEDDLFKICLWIQMIIGFKNTTKITQYHKQAMISLLGLVQVVLNRLCGGNKSSQQIKKVNSSPIKLLANKTLKFNSFNQLVEVFQTLMNCQQYFMYQIQQIDQSSPKYEQYVYATLRIQQTIKILLNYQNVKVLIKSEILEDQLRKSQQIIIQTQQVKLKQIKIDYLRKSKILKYLVNYLPLQEIQSQYKVFDFIQRTIQGLKNDDHKFINQITRLKIVQIQIQIVYEYWNNINNLKNSHIQQSNLQNLFKKIIKGGFGKNNDIKTIQQNLFNKISPHTIKKLINFQTSLFFSQFQKFIQKNDSYEKIINLFKTKLINQNQIQDNFNKIFVSKNIIIQYAEQMLGFNLVDLNQNKTQMFYIRDLQWKLFNYLKVLQLNLQTYLNLNQLKTELNSNINSKSQLDMNIRNDLKKVTKLMKTIYERNIKVCKNIKDMKKSRTPFTSISHLSMLPNRNTTQLIQKQQISQFNHTSQTILLSQSIKKSIQSQIKQYKKDQDLIRVSKFFMEIKAFDLVQFGGNVGTFLITQHFVVRNKTNQHVLMFCNRQQINTKSTLIHRIMYQFNAINYDPIQVDSFLKMHINQRVQLLKLILSKGVQKIDKKLKLSSQKNQRILSYIN